MVEAIVAILGALAPILAGAKTDLVLIVGGMITTGALAHWTFAPMLRDHFRGVTARGEELNKILNSLLISHHASSADLTDVRAGIAEVRTDVREIRTDVRAIREDLDSALDQSSRKTVA